MYVHQCFKSKKENEKALNYSSTNKQKVLMGVRKAQNLIFSHLDAYYYRFTVSFDKFFFCCKIRLMDVHRAKGELLNKNTSSLYLLMRLFQKESVCVANLYVCVYINEMCVSGNSDRVCNGRETHKSNVKMRPSLYL